MLSIMFVDLIRHSTLLVQKCGERKNIVGHRCSKYIVHNSFLTVSNQSMTSLQVDLGYKVARIEQTETPAQMSERCAQMSRPSKFDKGT